MTEAKASWVTAKPEDIKKQIIELAKQGMTSEKIGLVLRDQHGIPKARVIGIKIGKVLREANVWVDSENEGRAKKIETSSKHAATHKHDYTSIRSLTRTKALHAQRNKKR